MSDTSERQSAEYVRASVLDAGGGEIRLLVARDTQSYPEIGSLVELHVTHTMLACGHLAGIGASYCGHCGRPLSHEAFDAMAERTARQP